MEDSLGGFDLTRLLITALVSIVIFAALRGVFAFLQAYWAEKNSQSVAYDLRNDLYAKIQRLSFSYHDQNQTGQLMIRATDDVEKVRMFIGQGLLLALQALIVLVGALAILWFTNARLMLVILPVLPIALLVFIAFGAITQPLFTKVQQKLSALEPAAEVRPGTEATAIVRGSLDWPAAGALTARFGTQRDPRFGTTIVRAGIEIAATEHAPALAVQDGVVAWAEPFVGFGNLVIVDHGRQAYSLYGYLGAVSVTRAQTNP
jgi:murein DD-endopeptidase MepM/ murein hydrolase activator NlpD